MTKRELSRLKSKLPAGYRDALAATAGYSVPLIDKVFSGQNQNIKVIKAAIELAKAYQEELGQLSSDIKNL